MIVDHARFIALERPRWERLDRLLARRAADPWAPLNLAEVRELDELYQRATADLVRLSAYAAHPEVRDYVSSLVARGYAEIHGRGRAAGRFLIGRWARCTLPQAFRRRGRAFAVALALLLAGVVFGAGATAWDPSAKAVLVPFPHLRGDPRDRVAEEEREAGKHLAGRKATFSGELMTHNISVTLTSAAGGGTAGLLTALLTFYNGVTLGCICEDYLRAGEGVFLAGWLLPHGSAEIPALLLGAQAGFVLAGAFLRRADGERLGRRLKAVMPDFATLCGGAAGLLVWAGVVEAFLSQYHEPVVPYSAKIALGVVELAALGFYLSASGRERGSPAA